MAEYQRVVVDPQSWTGEDFFIAMNWPGQILVSPRGKEFLERHGFTNCELVPGRESKPWRPDWW